MARRACDVVKGATSGHQPLLGCNPSMVSLREVSRKVGAWARQPDPKLMKKLA